MKEKFIKNIVTKKTNQYGKNGLFFGVLIVGMVACNSNGSNVRAETTYVTPQVTKVVNNTNDSTRVSPSCETPFHEKLGVQWSNGATLYRGIMNLNGCQGQLVVSFWDDKSKTTAKVKQDIRISDSSMGIMLYGFKPVYSGTSLDYPNYAADNFLFQKQLDGTLLSYVCDDVKQCSPISFFTP